MFRDRRRGKDLERALERIRAESDQQALDSELWQEAGEEAQDLAALAMEVKESLGVPGPSPAFRRAAKARILRRVRLRATEGSRSLAPIERPRYLRPAYVLASLAMVIALLTTGIGVGHAAGNAIPGEPLYGVKQGIEQGRLLLSPTPEGDILLLSEFAAERLYEVERLLANDREEHVEKALDEYQATLSELVALAKQIETSGRPQLSQIQAALRHNVQVLTIVHENVPDQAKPAVQAALQRSNRGQEVLNQLELGDSPSDVAPGQLKKTEEALDPENGDEIGPGEEDPGGPPEDVETGPPDAPPGQDKDKDKDNKSNKGRRNRGEGNPDAPGLLE